MTYKFKYDGHTLQTESDSDWAEIEAIQKYKNKKKAKENKRKNELEDFIRKIVREEVEAALKADRNAEET